MPFDMPFNMRDVTTFDVFADAYRHLTDALGDAPLPNPTGWHVLVLQYVRPSRIGSILLSEKTLQEDAWQNRIGLVLRVGADAWNGKDRYPSGAWVTPGDSVMWRKLDNAALRFEVNGVSLCIVNDDAIVARDVDAFKVTG